MTIPVTVLAFCYTAGNGRRKRTISGSDIGGLTGYEERSVYGTGF